MRRASLFLAIALVSVGSQMTGSTGQGSSPAVVSPELRAQIAEFDTSTAAPVTVIVELMEQPAAVAAGRGVGRAALRQNQLNRIRTERGNVFSHLRRLGIQVSPRHEFELAYNGFVLTLPADQLPLLAMVPGIAGIHPDVEVVRESVSDTLVVDAQPELVNGVPAVGAPAAWDAGYRGTGMRIAIIDDGIDYTHPDLGGCLGPGCKVFAGYDFIELDDDPQQGYTTSGTPAVTTRDYHGTHVASTAAGLKGVAPEAGILGVRVLGSGGRSHLSALMAGIEFAMQHDVDVMSMSIGIANTTAQSTSPYALMTGNVVLSGVVWVNSNGNDGAAGAYRPNIYGASQLVIATGNADARPTGFPRTTVLATGEILVGGSFGMAFPVELLGTPLEVVDVGFGNTPEAYEGKDVAGRIAIASRGGALGEDATFVNKGNQAAAAGAAGLILSNNAAGEFSTAALAVPSFTVSQANGLVIRANPLIAVDTVNPGPQVAAGSSRGPTTDLQIKPDVAAPGTAIVAAVPFERSSTGYASASGTSMAAPHVAGAAILLRQAHPDWTPTQVKLALMNTATTLTTLQGVTFRTIEQGAGFIDVARALAPSLSARPGSVSFGQLGPAGFAASRDVEVSSTGTFDVSVQWIRSYAGVTASTSMSQIGAGQQTVGLTVGIDPNAPAGEYEGYLTFTNTASASDLYRVPFLFAHAIPVSQFNLSKVFARSLTAAPDSLDVTFSAGRELADWYLGSPAGTRFTVNQGPLGPGMKTYTWNLRTSTGSTLAQGIWTIGVWYRLPDSTTFVFGNAHGRLYVDNVAPLIGLDPGVPTLTNQPEVVIRGAVGDSGIWSFGEVAGGVFVNGQRADLYPRAPAQIFTGNNNELAFESTLALSEGSNAVAIYAEDAAGHRSASTIEFTIVLDTTPPVITFTGARTYTVEEMVEVTCTATDAGSGVATTTCGGAPLLRTDAWRLPLGPTTVSATATDYAGNTTNATATVTVAVTYSSLAALTSRFTSGALGRSLLAQLNASRMAAARGDVGGANGALQAYVQEVQAQAGKHLTAEQAAALVRFAAGLMQ
jgi:minor extracellular serine protease Vpr